MGALDAHRDVANVFRRRVGAVTFEASDCDRRVIRPPRDGTAVPVQRDGGTLTVTLPAQKLDGPSLIRFTLVA